MYCDLLIQVGILEMLTYPSYEIMDKDTKY